MGFNLDHQAIERRKLPKLRGTLGGCDHWLRLRCTGSLDCVRCFALVYVIQDEQPAGVLLEPPQRRPDLDFLVRRSTLGQVQHRDRAQGSNVLTKGGRAVGAHNDLCGIFGFVRKGILDAEPRLADAAERPCTTTGRCSARE